ncbi:MAG TPA: alpha/beta family hydrolase [Gemmatimonadota bacterium]|nr:alpha/beta family hydrolase [Gemmatimonadota bacterium]
MTAREIAGRPADTETRFPAGAAGPVSALLRRPEGADRLLVLAHGAGAGMRHAFMEGLATALAEHGIASFRYQFPYSEAGRRRPDREPVLRATVAAAVEAAREPAGDLPLLAGGKSMGGRMTSRAAAIDGLREVRGLVFFGFPLHPPGKPSTDRADHLEDVEMPMLFLQGDRDAFAGLDLLEPVVGRLGRRATLHLVAGADHGFHLPKRSGRTDDDVLAELARRTDEWSAGILAARP